MTPPENMSRAALIAEVRRLRSQACGYCLSWRCLGCGRWTEVTASEPIPKGVMPNLRCRSCGTLRLGGD